MTILSKNIKFNLNPFKFGGCEMIGSNLPDIRQLQCGGGGHTHAPTWLPCDANLGTSADSSTSAKVNLKRTPATQQQQQR